MKEDEEDGEPNTCEKEMEMDFEDIRQKKDEKEGRSFATIMKSGK